MGKDYEAEARVKYDEAVKELESVERNHYKQMSLDDFCAYPHTNQYIDLATGNMWNARGVDRKIPPVTQFGEADPIPASLYLDRHAYVTQIGWVPGEPQFINNCIIRDGGLTHCKGHSIYNSYCPPTIVLGDWKKAEPWLKHVIKCFSEEDVKHIVGYLAHAVQRPWEKCNHALLLLSRKEGIGKDTLLAPAREAVGIANCAEVSPEQFMGTFNGFAKSVLLRINEAKDLGGDHGKSRFAFYDRLKLYAACPPEVIRCNEKFKPEQHVLNRCHVVITSNYIAGGLYVPKESRRLYVAESQLLPEDFEADYFDNLWKFFEEEDGFAHVAAYLHRYPLSTFGYVHKPPPKTAAFWALVGSNSSPETATVENILDQLGRPEAVTVSRIMRQAANDFSIASSRIRHFLEECGYRYYPNPAADNTYWRINKKQEAVYVKEGMSLQECQVAVDAMKAVFRKGGG